MNNNNFSDRLKTCFGFRDPMWKGPIKLVINSIENDKESLDDLVSKYKDKELTVLQFKKDGIVSIYLPTPNQEFLSKVTSARVPILDSKFAGIDTEYGIIHFTTKKLSELLDAGVQVLGTYLIEDSGSILKEDYVNFAVPIAAIAKGAMYAAQIWEVLPDDLKKNILKYTKKKVPDVIGALAGLFDSANK